MSSSPHLVTRTISLAQMAGTDCEECVTEALSLVDGVQKIAADWKQGLVTVTYDLHVTRLNEVEKILVDIGYSLADGFMATRKREWQHYTEKNEMDNLKHVAHCCSKPPQGK